MDFSDLVSALENNDSDRVNELLKAFYPRLMGFLRIHLNANTTDAEDCAQETLMLSVEAIKEGQLKDHSRVVPYILTVCRNIYLHKQRKERELYLEDIFTEKRRYQEPQQLENLFEKEQEKLLEWCLSQLREKYQLFIQYWLDHPEAQAKKVAEHFNISISNAWTRKHRVIKKLNECYRKKIEI